MSRKKKRARGARGEHGIVSNGVPKSGPVWHLSAEEATLARMPKYNAHACGAGIHGDVKYNRARQKQEWRKELNLEGPRNRGVLPVFLQNTSFASANDAREGAVSVTADVRMGQKLTKGNHHPGESLPRRSLIGNNPPIATPEVLDRR